MLLTHNIFENKYSILALEAMQFNLPQISTFEGAIAEIIENGANGFLIKQRDSVDLANKIQQLIEILP